MEKVIIYNEVPNILTNNPIETGPDLGLFLYLKDSNKLQNYKLLLIFEFGGSGARIHYYDINSKNEFDAKFDSTKYLNVKEIQNFNKTLDETFHSFACSRIRNVDSHYSPEPV